MPLLVHMVCWWLLGLAVGGRATMRATMPAAPGALLANTRADTLALLPVLIVAVVFVALLLRVWRSHRRGAPASVHHLVWWRDARLVGAPLFALAGALIAQAARTEQHSCRTRLAAAAQAGDTLQVLVDDVAAGRGQRGSFVRGVAELPSRPTLRACAVPATLRWYGALPRPGERLPAPGVVTTTARGLRIEQTAKEAGAPRDEAAAAPLEATTAKRDLLRAWRGHLGESIDTHFRARAPLVRALLIADQDGIDPALRDRYADAGLVHMLSVSGMHVAIIASALLTLGGMLRVPRRWLEPAALAMVCAYVLLLGAPAPAVRSAIMLAVVTLSARWQRPVHEWTALALGALVPTHNPLVVSDLGYQLSVSGMAALVAARAARRRWRYWAREQVMLRSRSLTLRSRDAANRHASHRDFRALMHERAREFAVNVAHWRGLRGWLVTECLTGCVATIVTAPLIAWTFGRISLVAPLSNLAAAPIVGLLQPALFLALAWAMLLERWQGLAIWLPDATQPFMAALDALAAWTAELPFAVWPVAPSLAVAIGAGATMAMLVRSTASRAGTRDATRWRIGAAAIATATLWWAAADAQGLTHELAARFGGPVGARGILEMHMLDVGQGDAVALRTPRGRWVLVDAGPRWQGGDAGRRTVVPHLRRRGGELALFVLSHAHDDHAGGAASVVQALKPRLWWESAWVGTSPGYREALTQLHRKGLRWQRVRPGQSLTLDGVHFDVLAPDSTWTAAQHDANETSVVLRVRHGAHRFLLTGDAEGEEEAWLLSRYTPDELRADVLKVGHHGSRTSSSPALLDAVTPRVALASLGAGNRYGHPALETLEAFHARGVPLLRTDLEGAMVVRSDGKNLEVESRGERWRVP